MSISWWILFNTSVAVYAVIAVGATLRRVGWLTEEADQSLLRLVIRVLYPALIFSIVSNNPALKQAGNLLLAPLIGFGTIALGLGLAGAVGRLPMRWNGLTSDRQRRTFAACVGIYNYGYIPIPLVKLLFGDATLGVLFVHNVGAELAVWTLGVLLLSGHLGRDKGSGTVCAEHPEGRSGKRYLTPFPVWLSGMLNAPTIAIVLALAVNFLGAAGLLPECLAKAVEWLGQAAIPMSMVLIGAVLADEMRPGEQSPTRAQGAKLVAWSLLLRLGLLPLGFLLLAMALPCSIELKRVVVIQAAMPAATFPIVLARHYGGDPGVGVRVALGTAIVSLITIPLWVPAGMHWLGIS
jgi:predicted permease